MDDALMGLGAPEWEAHLAHCALCRGRLEAFRREVREFNQASLAWSEARAAQVPRAAPRPKARPALAAAAGWVLAAAVLLAIALPVWNHQHGSSPGYASRDASGDAPAAVSVPGDSEAQIAEDNELLRSVNAVLNSDEASPISEYHLADGPRARLKGRRELRNR